MKKYVCWVAENIYGGLHGIEEWFIEEADDVHELEQFLANRSLELMNEFSSVVDLLEEDIQNNIEDNMTDEQINELRDEIYTENINVNWWKIDMNYFIKDGLDKLPESEVDEMLCNDPEEFIDRYCF